jgi:hypothetical protein
VRDQIKNFKPNIEGYLNELLKPTSQSLLPAVIPKQNIENRPSPPSGSPEDIEFIEVNAHMDIRYENVLEINDGTVQVITEIPGDNLAKRMINLVLIYLWGNLLIGKQEISFTELRLVCQRHGELDGSNFAKQIRFHKKYFIVGGSGKFQSAKLIRPGVKEATKLISELNSI